MKEFLNFFPLFQGLLLRKKEKRRDWKEIIIVVAAVCSIITLVQYAFFGRFEDRFSRIEKDIKELRDGQKALETKFERKIDKIDDKLDRILANQK